VPEDRAEVGARASTELRPQGAFAELCLHVLAHVPLRDAGSSFAPDYLAWAIGVGATDGQARDDGARIAACLRPSSRALLHRWPALHTSLAGFHATRTRAIAELADREVDDPDLLHALQAADDPALELAHAMLALAAPTWSRIHAARIAAPLEAACCAAQPLLTRACTRVPSLTAARLELSWVLGPRGRAYADRIVVGAPAPWHDGGAAQSVVLALHEHAVRDLADRDAGGGDWADVEWWALRHVAARLVGDGELAAAHARWLAQLDLTGLVAILCERGAIDAALATRLLAEPGARAALLI